MAESIGLIERAAALLRQQHSFEPDSLPHPVAEAVPAPQLRHSTAAGLHVDQVEMRKLKSPLNTGYSAEVRCSRAKRSR